MAPPAPPLALTHPALLAVLLVAAACLVVSASYVLYDTDLWQHLVMGRAIWETGGVPRTQLWTWPQYGEPCFLSSWGFRALVWPVWSGGGIAGLFAWRWVTTLGVFVFVFATARAMGARGLSAVLVLVWYSLDYRLRTDVRPETLASLFFAAQLWILERHRLAPAGDVRAARRTWWIAGLACAWANVHISYYLGFALLALHLADAHVAAAKTGAAGEAGRARARQLWRVAAVAAGASFLNPFGGVALWQPFEFALAWRSDPLMRTIGELYPVPLDVAVRNGLPLWPLLLLWRARRRGWDVAELLACLAFTGLALSSIRFMATYALIAAPFVARDLHDLFTSRRWPVPVVTLPGRAILTAAACVLLCIGDWIRPDLPLGIGLDPVTYPEKACDFMAAHGLRGRGFNHTHHGGYLAYRFWPDRDRLPFISTQPEYARPEERRLYVQALLGPAGWQALDDRHRFEWVLLDREQAGDDVLLETLDADTSWAMIFADDAAELFVRRDGPYEALADSFGYRVVPAGKERRRALVGACELHPRLRALARAELERQIAGSPLHGGASHLLGILELMDRRYVEARTRLERALALKPLLPNVHDLLGTIALAEQRWADAARELGRERRFHQAPSGNFYRTGLAHQKLGDWKRARGFYRRELARDAASPAADSLAKLEAGR